MSRSDLIKNLSTYFRISIQQATSTVKQLEKTGGKTFTPRKPKRKKKSSTIKRAPNPNATRAMKLYSSGQASSLAEAWEMVRNGR